MTTFTPLLDYVFSVMNTKATPWLLSGGILLFAFAMYLKFKSLLMPLSDDLNRALTAVDKFKNGELSFGDLSVVFEQQKFLNEAWRSFKRALIVHRDELDGRETYVMPQYAGAHLNEARIIGSAINIRFYQALPNTLVGVGLFFTFIGLVMALYFASKGVGAKDVEVAQLALKDLLDAATFKFLTSLAGLLASLTFSWREKAVLHGVTSLIADLTLRLDSAFERTSIEQLAHQRNASMQKHEAILREQLDESRQQTAQLKRFETDFAVSIANALDNRLSPRFEHLADTLSSAIEQLSSKIGTVNEDALKTMIDDFRRTLTEGAGAEIGKMSEVIATLAERLESSGTDLQGKLSGAGEDIAGGAKLLEDVLINLKADVVDLEGVVKQATDSAERTTTLLGQNVGELVTLHNSLGQTLTGLKDVGTTIDDTATTLDSSIKGLIQSQESTSTQVRQMLEGARSALSSIEQSGNQVQAVSAALKNAWEAYQGRFESVDEDLEAVFNSLQDGLDNYSEKVKQFHVGLDKQMGTAIQSLGALVQELSDTAEELAEARRSKN